FLVSWVAAAALGAERKAEPARTNTAADAVSASVVEPNTASPLRLGTNVLAAHRILRFLAPLNAYAKAQLPRLGVTATVAFGAMAFPEGWDAGRPVPILVVCSPSGAPAIPQLAAYTNAALSAGWAVVAGDGPRVPPDRDSVLWNWGMVSSVLEYVQITLPRARAWPVAVAGFSGGAKRAACVAAAFAEARRPVWGVFMGGCNEDKATTGALLFRAGTAFLGTPMFLSNGNNDPIAGPAAGGSVRTLMERSGFSNVRAEIYAGGHQLSGDQLARALSWFAEGKSVAGATARPVSTLR
ncbi:MAG: hypothetical protein JNL97_00945, partial [Verrucomicrobiales bacterium]|nr:hypothetical protein [Verrucomicrobiales bacterium]